MGTQAGILHILLQHVYNYNLLQHGEMGKKDIKDETRLKRQKHTNGVWVRIVF